MFLAPIDSPPSELLSLGVHMAAIQPSNRAQNPHQRPAETRTSSPRTPYSKLLIGHSERPCSNLVGLMDDGTRSLLLAADTTRLHGHQISFTGLSPPGGAARVEDGSGSEPANQDGQVEDANSPNAPEQSICSTAARTPALQRGTDR